MDFEVYHKYPPGDPILVDKIVCHLKAQGIFDNFRKECLSDVDTKPAYQNLRQRVDGSVAGYLAGHKWKPDLNKNQLRECLRKYIQNGGFLEVGVERIVDQVVNPKIGQVFLPRVRDVVFEGLGLKEEIENNVSDRQASTSYHHQQVPSSSATSSTYKSASLPNQIDDSKENAALEKEPVLSGVCEVKKEDDYSEKVQEEIVASEVELEPVIETEEAPIHLETQIESRSNDSSDTRISGISDLTSVKSGNSLKDLIASDDEDDDNFGKSVNTDNDGEKEDYVADDIDKSMTSVNEDDVEDSHDKSEQPSYSNYEKSYSNFGFLSEFSTQVENVEIETNQIGTSVVECVTTSENNEEYTRGRDSPNFITKNIELNYDSDSSGKYRKEIELQQSTEIEYDYNDDDNAYEESSRALNSDHKEESHLEESQSEPDVERLDSTSNEIKLSENTNCFDDENLHKSSEDERFERQSYEEKEKLERRIEKERKYRKEQERKHHSKHKHSKHHHYTSSSGESRDDRKHRKSKHSKDKHRHNRDDDSHSSSVEEKSRKTCDSLDSKHRRSRHGEEATFHQEQASIGEPDEKNEYQEKVKYSHKERPSRLRDHKKASKVEDRDDEYGVATFDQEEASISESDERNKYQEKVEYSLRKRSSRSSDHKIATKEKVNEDEYEVATFDQEETSISESDEMNKYQEVKYSHKERPSRLRDYKKASEAKAHDKYEEATFDQEEASISESNEKNKYQEKVEYSLRKRSSRSSDHKIATKEKVNENEYEVATFDQEETSISESDEKNKYQEVKYSHKERPSRSRDHKKASKVNAHDDDYEVATFDQEEASISESDEKSKYQEVKYSHRERSSRSRDHKKAAKVKAHGDEYEVATFEQEEASISESDEKNKYQEEVKYSHRERSSRSRDHKKAAKVKAHDDEYEVATFEQEEASISESDEKNKYQEELKYSHKERPSRSRDHKKASKVKAHDDEYEVATFDQEEASISKSDEKNKYQEVKYSHKERPSRSRDHKKASKVNAHDDDYEIATFDQEEASISESDEKNKYQEEVKYSHRERSSRSRDHKKVAKVKAHGDEYEVATFEQEEASISESDEKNKYQEVKYSHKERPSRSRDHKKATNVKAHDDEYEVATFGQGGEASVSESEEMDKYQEKVEFSHKEWHTRSRDHRNASREKAHDYDQKHGDEQHRHHGSDSDKKKNDSSSKNKRSTSQDDKQEDRSHKSSSKEHRSSHHRSSRDKHARKGLEKYDNEKQKVEKNNDDMGRKDKDKSKKNRDNCKPADKSREHRRSADRDSSGTGDSRNLGSAGSSRSTRSNRSKTKEKSGHRSGGKSSRSSTSEAILSPVMLEESKDYFEQNDGEHYVATGSETTLQPSFSNIDSLMDGNEVCHMDSGVCSDNENNLRSVGRFVSKEDGDTQMGQEKTAYKGEKAGDDAPEKQEKEKRRHDITKLANNNDRKITLEFNTSRISKNELEFKEESERSTINSPSNLQENLDSSDYVVENMKNCEGQEKIVYQVKDQDAAVLVSEIDAKQVGGSNSLCENEEIQPTKSNSDSVVTSQNVETQLPKDDNTSFRRKRFAANIAEVRKIMRERRRNERIEKKRLSSGDSAPNDHSSMITQTVDNQTAMEESVLVETTNQVEKSVECNKEISAPMPNQPHFKNSAECTEQDLQNQDAPHAPPVPENEVNSFKYKRPKFAANIYEVRKIIKARRRLRRMEGKRLSTPKCEELNQCSVNQETVEGESKSQFEDVKENEANSPEHVSRNTRKQSERRAAKIVLNMMECDSTDDKTEENETENLITLKIKTQECVESGSEVFECKSSLSYQDINQLASKCLVVQLKKLDEDNLVMVKNETGNSIKTSNQSGLQDDLADPELTLQGNNNENNCDTIEDSSSFITNEIKASEDEPHDLEVKEVDEAVLSAHECELENEDYSSLKTITVEDEESNLYDKPKCSTEVLKSENPDPSKTANFEGEMTGSLSSGKSNSIVKVTKVENSSASEMIGLSDDVTRTRSCEESESDVESLGTSETIAMVDDITESHSSEKPESVEVPELEGFDTSETINLEDDPTESQSSEKIKSIEEVPKVENLSQKDDPTESQSSKKMKSIEVPKVENLSQKDDPTESQSSEKIKSIEEVPKVENLSQKDDPTESQSSEKIKSIEEVPKVENLSQKDDPTESQSSGKLKSIEEVPKVENLSQKDGPTESQSSEKIRSIEEVPKVENLSQKDDPTESQSSEKIRSIEEVPKVENLSQKDDPTESQSSEKMKSIEEVPKVENLSQKDDPTESQSSEKIKSIEEVPKVENLSQKDGPTESQSSEKIRSIEEVPKVENLSQKDDPTESQSSGKLKSIEVPKVENLSLLETTVSGIDTNESHSFEELSSVTKVESSSPSKTNLSPLKTIGSGIETSESQSCEELTYPPKVEISSPSKIIGFHNDNGIKISSCEESKSPVEALKVCEMIVSNTNIENEDSDRIGFLNEDSSIKDGFCYFEQNETDNAVERLGNFKSYLNNFEKEYKYLKDMEKTDLVTSDFALDRKFDSYLEKECGFQVLRKDCILLPSLNDENYYFDKESGWYYLKNRLVASSEISKDNLDFHQQKSSGKNRKVLRSGRSRECVEEKRSSKSVFQDQRKSPVKLRISIRNPNSSVIETEEINVPYTSDVESSTDGSAGRISTDSRKSVEDAVAECEPNNCEDPVRASTPLHDDTTSESETVERISDEASHSENSFKSTKNKRGHSRRKRSSNSNATETITSHQEFKIKTCPEAENNNVPSAEGAANLNSFKITLSRNNSNLSRVIAPQSPSSQSNNFSANNVLSSTDAAVPSESESKFIIGKRHSSKTDSVEDSRRSPKKKYDSLFSVADFQNTDQAIETVTDSLNNSFEDEADISHDENMTSNMIGEALKNLIAESGLVTTTSQPPPTYHETKEPARVTRQQRNQRMSDVPEDTVSPPKRLRNSQRLSAGVKLPRRYENTDFYKPRSDSGQCNRRKRKPDEPVLDSLVDNEPPKKRKLSNVVGSARRRSR